MTCLHPITDFAWDQYPTVVESEGAERITVRNPPLSQEDQ